MNDTAKQQRVEWRKASWRSNAELSDARNEHSDQRFVGHSDQKTK